MRPDKAYEAMRMLGPRSLNQAYGQVSPDNLAGPVARDKEGYFPSQRTYDESTARPTAIFRALLNIFGSWRTEAHCAMSLAIKLRWEDYVIARLNPDLLRQKSSRPLLSYALCPSFADDLLGRWWTYGPNLSIIKTHVTKVEILAALTNLAGSGAYDTEKGYQSFSDHQVSLEKQLSKLKPMRRNPIASSASNSPVQILRCLQTTQRLHLNCHYSL
jgi:hypothetical protein